MLPEIAMPPSPPPPPIDCATMPLGVIPMVVICEVPVTLTSDALPAVPPEPPTPMSAARPLPTVPVIAMPPSPPPPPIDCAAMPCEKSCRVAISARLRP